MLAVIASIGILDLIAVVILFSKLQQDKAQSDGSYAVEPENIVYDHEDLSPAVKHDVSLAPWTWPGRMSEHEQRQASVMFEKLSAEMQSARRQ